ncbi:tRNA G10 N-methylase Trm11 [Paenibacillus shirakamiensis]|uniref:tRNA G10 N-methylase Trm11 n=1 Tax=Paenibacillus shirakamiensis TaxID=1265935 RepID=A0ABS4JJW6_9BACL|nr:RsmD family RNA methyltransferase [Paenibacillus shirakamiensis]MBP2001978.1 tRNA G10 N-methylase Trm11 [Paenibacillus shirakamiensis]
MTYVAVEASEFIYTYAYPEEEESLCRLEARCLFGSEPHPYLLKSSVGLDPSRSPFIRERIDIMYEGDTLEDIYRQVEAINMGEETFKVLFVKINDLTDTNKIEYDERRAIEREMGLHIEGEADVNRPDHWFGLIALGGKWYFGPYQRNKSLWLLHMKKPRSYSIALSTRVARAAANIAVPEINGKHAIDPCCGIGTVLVEALSMGISITGRDINPHIAQGARDNIVHFGYEAEVTLGDIAEITDHYDAAIVDMPYNHFSRTTPEAQFSILEHAARIADRVVVISVDSPDEMLTRAGLSVIDRGKVRKAGFSRQVIVCASNRVD